MAATRLRWRTCRRRGIEARSPSRSSCGLLSDAAASARRHFPPDQQAMLLHRLERSDHGAEKRFRIRRVVAILFQPLDERALTCDAVMRVQDMAVGFPEMLQLHLMIGAFPAGLADVAGERIDGLQQGLRVARFLQEWHMGVAFRQNAARM